MRVEKIVAKMKRTKFGYTFEDCEKVIVSKGYNLARIKGSHHTFINGSKMITLAKHKPMSPDAVKDVIKIWDNSY